MNRISWARRSTGYTIVELLVVIVVIGILASLTVIAFDNVQTRARDAKRVNDIAQLTKAMNSWVLKNDKAPNTTGAGYNGTGVGWVYEPSYTLNIEKVLQDARLIYGAVRDPETPTGTGSYMFYDCPETASSTPRYFAFFARVEKLSEAEGNEYSKWLAMGCTDYGSSYGMNYLRLVPYRG